MSNDHPRQFKIETILYKQHTLNFVYFEHEKRHQHQLSTNWTTQIEQILNQTNIVFLEYHPQELPHTTYSIPLIGSLAKTYATHFAGIETHFSTILKLTHPKNIPTATADIANKPLFSLYEFSFLVFLSLISPLGFVYSLLYSFQYISQTGIFSPQPNWVDIPTLSLTDARRHLYAKSITDYLQQQTQPTKLTLISAPAHTSRIKKYISHPTKTHFLKTKIYSLIPFLDKHIRFF